MQLLWIKLQEASRTGECTILRPISSIVYSGCLRYDNSLYVEQQEFRPPIEFPFGNFWQKYFEANLCEEHWRNGVVVRASAS